LSNKKNISSNYKNCIQDLKIYYGLPPYYKKNEFLYQSKYFFKTIKKNYEDSVFEDALDDVKRQLVKFNTHILSSQNSI